MKHVVPSLLMLAQGLPFASRLLPFLAYEHIPPRADWEREYADGRWSYLAGLKELAHYSIISLRSVYKVKVETHAGSAGVAGELGWGAWLWDDRPTRRQPRVGDPEQAVRRPSLTNHGRGRGAANRRREPGERVARLG